MKHLLFLLPFLFGLVSAPFASAVTITGHDETPGQTITQLPGSPTDYYFVRNSSLETDFSLTYVDPTQYAYYSLMNNPAGGAEYTGITFEHLAQGQLTNLASFTLGSGDASFNYSNFNVYVLYDNTSFGPGVYDGNSIDDQIALGAGADATGASATAVTVSDPSVKIDNAGRYVEFNVQGLAAGDEFTIAASDLNSGNNTAYIGAVSLESAPEPSTYAMMLGGLALLGFCVRRKLA
jgi:hypothetical protein